MKKYLLLVLVAFGLVAFIPQPAKAHVSFGISVGVPVYYGGDYCYGYPYYGYASYGYPYYYRPWYYRHYYYRPSYYCRYYRHWHH